MKYVVKATGLYHIDDYFANGEGFPANIKGFDYDNALELGLIEENKDGVDSDGEPKKADRKRVQVETTNGNSAPASDN